MCHAHYNKRHTMQQGSSTCGPRAKCGPFQKKLWPFLNSEEQKKGHQKILKKMAKKYELMALNKKGL